MVNLSPDRRKELEVLLSIIKNIDVMYSGMYAGEENVETIHPANAVPIPPYQRLNSYLEDGRQVFLNTQGNEINEDRRRIKELQEIYKKRIIELVRSEVPIAPPKK